MSFISIALRSSRFILLLCLLTTPAILATGQILQVDHLEIPQREGESDRFHATALGENGIMLYNLVRGRTDQVELIKLDTSLIEQWRGVITLGRNSSLFRVQRNSNSFFLLLKDLNTLGGDFQIIAVQFNTSDFVRYNVKNLIPFSPTEFVITDDAAFIGGYFNYRPLVLYYNFGLQRSKILPGFFNEPGEMNQLKAYEDGSIDVVVSSKNLEKRRALSIRNYDAAGDLIKTTLINPEENKHLIFGRSVRLDSGNQIVAGVYGRFQEYSRGIFVARINAIGEYTILYYNFSQLKNFFSYMKAKRQKRIKERIDRRTIRGKKVKFNYRFMIHDLIPYKNQYIMTGEAFYPRYIYPNSFNFGSQRSTQLIFDGYQFTHAVVIGLDNKGKLRWDNSFEINDVKTMQLDPLVKVKPSAERIVMMYLFENKVRAKIIRDSEVIEGKTQDPLNAETVSDGKTNEGEQFDFWYGDYFYACGTQKIKQKSGTFKRIFFINKITYP